jgi:hypothetical protein
MRIVMNKNRIYSRLQKLLPLLMIFDLVQVLFVGGIWSGIWYKNDLDARKEIAERLQIEPSWQSLEYYIETHFVGGMTRADIVKQAEEIGYENINIYFLGEIYCEVYSFSVGPFSSPRGGRWSICYDEDENVISIERVLSA